MQNIPMEMNICTFGFLLLDAFICSAVPTLGIKLCLAGALNCLPSQLIFRFRCDHMPRNPDVMSFADAQDVLHNSLSCLEIVFSISWHKILSSWLKCLH